MKLTLWEDDQACITVFVKSYSPKLRHIQRTHKINLGSVKEMIGDTDNSLKPDLLRMRYAGVECQDGATLAEINFCDASSVTVERRFAFTSRASTSGATHVEQEAEAAE